MNSSLGLSVRLLLREVRVPTELIGVCANIIQTHGMKKFSVQVLVAASASRADYHTMTIPCICKAALSLVSGTRCEMMARVWSAASIRSSKV